MIRQTRPSVGRPRGRRKRRLHVHGVLPELETLVRLLRHVLNEPHLILPAYLVLLSLVLLIHNVSALLEQPILFLPCPLHPLLDLLTLLHLLQLSDLLHLLQHFRVDLDPLRHLHLSMGVATLGRLLTPSVGWS